MSIVFDLIRHSTSKECSMAAEQNPNYYERLSNIDLQCSVFSVSIHNHPSDNVDVQCSVAHLVWSSVSDSLHYAPHIYLDGLDVLFLEPFLLLLLFRVFRLFHSSISQISCLSTTHSAHRLFALFLNHIQRFAFIFQFP